MATVLAALVAGVVWLGLRAEVGWDTFAFGALLGAAFWRFEGSGSRRAFELKRALRRSGYALQFLALFLWELALAGREQLRVVLARRIDVEPAWLRLRTELETPALRALFGAALSLTPGSLTYETTFDDDGVFVICLHVLDLREPERMVAQIRRHLEAPLLAMEQL